MIDIQSQRDHRRVEINKVGVKNIEYPITVLDKRNKIQHTVGRVNMYVNLPHQFKGTHMSRFIEILNEYRGTVNIKAILTILNQMKKKLAAESAYKEVEFPYFIEKRAPVSGAKSLMGYTCRFLASLISGHYSLIVGVTVPVSTLCPCSKELSEKGAHNQRGLVTVQVKFAPEASPDEFNSYAQFLLGLTDYANKSIQYELSTGREWMYSGFFRDRWQVNKKLTINLGLRYEMYSLMTRENRGIEYYDETTNKVLLGGVGGNPEDLGIEVKHPKFLPRVGFSYRLTDNDVVRGGYGITVSPIPFSRPLRSFYPSVISNDFVSDSSYVPYGSLATGIPLFYGPDLSSGVLDILTDAFFLRYCLPVAVGSYLIVFWNLRKWLKGTRVKMAELDIIDRHTADVRFLQASRHGEVLTPVEFIHDHRKIIGPYFEPLLQRLHIGEPLGSALVREGVPDGVRKKILGQFIAEELADALDRHYVHEVMEDNDAKDNSAHKIRSIIETLAP